MVGGDWKIRKAKVAVIRKIKKASPSVRISSCIAASRGRAVAAIVSHRRQKLPTPDHLQKATTPPAKVLLLIQILVNHYLPHANVNDLYPI